jgi:hypothetical protein
MKKYERASDLNARMKNVRSKDRPTCGEILESRHLWTLNSIEFDLKSELESIKSGSVVESYLLSAIKDRYKLDRGTKSISNFKISFNRKRDLIRNSFFNIELLHLFPSLKSKTHAKEKNLRDVMKDVYNSPMIIKTLTFLFVFAALVDSIRTSGTYFAEIFAILIALPLITIGFYFDFLITCFLIFSNQFVSAFIFEKRSGIIFIITSIFVNAILVTLILAVLILKLFLTFAFIITLIIILAVIFDALFFDRSIFTALIRCFGEYVLCFSLLSIFILSILIFQSYFLNNLFLNHCFIDTIIANLSKFALFFCIFFVLNFWFFIFVEIIFNNPILNCRKSGSYTYDEYFIYAIRLVILFFIFIFTVSVSILDFFFTYAFVISVLIVWSIFSDALINHRDFIKEFVISFHRYILSFCVFSYINYSVLFFYAIIFENPIIDRRFVLTFNPSSSLFEYSFLILFIIFFWFLKLVDHFMNSLILNRRITFGLGELVVSSCLFSITFFCFANSIIPVFDRTILNHRLIKILIAGFDKFILLFCTLHIFIYIIVLSIAVFLNKFRTLNRSFFGAIFASFTKFFLSFCVFSFIMPKLPIIDRFILVFYNSIIFISIILGLKFHFKKFSFGYLIKPASLFGVLIISLLIFGTDNFLNFISSYSFLFIYCFFIIANYS